MATSSSGKKQVAKPPGKNVRYGIPAEVFISTWEASATIHEVYESLKKYSEQHGTPVMPQPIIASRAAEYREKLPLKRMPRIGKRNLDAKALAAVVAKVRSEKGDATGDDEPVLTRAQVEEVVVEVLERYGLVERGAK